MKNSNCNKIFTFSSFKEKEESKNLFCNIRLITFSSEKKKEKKRIEKAEYSKRSQLLRKKNY